MVDVMSIDDPRPYDPTRYEPAPAPQTPAPPPAAAEPQVTEKWAFRSRTVQRIIVAGIMWKLSTTPLASYVDQQMVADFVRMTFEWLPEVFQGLGTLAMGGAIRARQIAGPEKLYWLPRTRDQRAPVLAAA